MSYAPIALFCYNRPNHLKKTLDALKQCRESKSSQIYFFQDGSNTPCKKVNEVTNLIESYAIGKRKEIIIHPVNKGLAKCITEGITYVLDRHSEIIVLEDDIMVSPGFLDYMNQSLTLYRNSPQVMHISGYMFPLAEDLPNTFFYNTASCWGWATWKTSWSNYSSDCDSFYHDLLKKPDQLYKFNIEGTADFFQQLELNVTGNLSTWAIKWYSAIFRKNGYALHPGTSLTKNIGMDGSGQNCSSTKAFDSVVTSKIEVNKIDIIEDKYVRALMTSFYEQQNKKPHTLTRVKVRVKKMIESIWK